MRGSKGDCVAVQLAALLKLPLAQVHDEIEARWQSSAQAGQESWRTAGVDSRIVGAFATNRGMNCHVVWKGQKIREFWRAATGGRAASPTPWTACTRGSTATRRPAAPSVT